MTTRAQIFPTTKDECKNGGFERFGIFKNQGDCVSYVATGGNNPPAEYRIGPRTSGAVSCNHASVALQG